jgi:hypothetical protein
MAFVRNGVAEGNCDHPHEFAAAVKVLFVEHFWAAAIRHRGRRKQPGPIDKKQEC